MPGERNSVQSAYDSLHNVINICKVTAHIAVVEHLDRLALQDGLGKEHRSHIRPAPGAVDGEKPQPCGFHPVQAAVAGSHQLICLLRGGIQALGVVDIVRFLEGYLLVASVHRT